MAELEAVKVTVWGAAAVTLKGELGEVVSPAGRPEIAMETVPENPFRAVIESCTFVEPPAANVSDCELGWMLKSGDGGGGGGWLALPPPQPEESSVSRTKPKRNKKSERTRTDGFGEAVRWRLTRTLPQISSKLTNLFISRFRPRPYSRQIRKPVARVTLGWKPMKCSFGRHSS